MCWWMSNVKMSNFSENSNNYQEIVIVDRFRAFFGEFAAIVTMQFSNRICRERSDGYLRFTVTMSRVYRQSGYPEQPTN